MKNKNELTPKKVVEELNKYIIGQDEAKRQVAIALRNRIRRLALDEDIRKDVIPKNILMIGPTGVGKTEIARRLAEIANAPFAKFEATRFTEVGYVGKNVESMVRELVDISMNMVRKEMMEEVKDKAQKAVEERIAEALVPPEKKYRQQQASFMDMFQMLNQGNQYSREKPIEEDESVIRRRQEILEKLRNKELEDVEIEIEVEEQSAPMFAGLGPEFEDMGIQFGEMFQNLMPKKKKRRRMKISEARRVLEPIEAEKFIDQDKLVQEGLNRAENSGIIFIDEVDKVTSKGGSSSGPDVSREGVQRDLLPIVEGTTILTKYGSIKTDYILFIAAGAFSESKPSDLIPELQGRFPIRAELSDLTKEDFVRILTQPKNAILKQYKYLLQTDGVNIEFTEDGIERMADIAFELNEKVENIGARRLYTIVEKVLEEVSYEAPASGEWELKIDKNYVDLRLNKIFGDEDLREYIL